MGSLYVLLQNNQYHLKSILNLHANCIHPKQTFTPTSTKVCFILVTGTEPVRCPNGRLEKVNTNYLIGKLKEAPIGTLDEYRGCSNNIIYSWT
jgi:hypothetical protein